jgi:hypothetical protein
MDIIITSLEEHFKRQNSHLSFRTHLALLTRLFLDSGGGERRAYALEYIFMQYRSGTKSTFQERKLLCGFSNIIYLSSCSECTACDELSYNEIFYFPQKSALSWQWCARSFARYLNICLYTRIGAPSKSLKPHLFYVYFRAQKDPLRQTTNLVSDLFQRF